MEHGILDIKLNTNNLISYRKSFGTANTSTEPSQSSQMADDNTPKHQSFWSKNKKTMIYSAGSFIAGAAVFGIITRKNPRVKLFSKMDKLRQEFFKNLNIMQKQADEIDSSVSASVAESYKDLFNLKDTLTQIKQGLDKKNSKVSKFKLKKLNRRLEQFNKLDFSDSGIDAQIKKIYDDAKHSLSVAQSKSVEDKKLILNTLYPENAKIKVIEEIEKTIGTRSNLSKQLDKETQILWWTCEKSMAKLNENISNDIAYVQKEAKEALSLRQAVNEKVAALNAALGL